MSKDYFPWFSFFLRFFDMGRIVGIFISAGFDKKKRKDTPLLEYVFLML